MYAHVCECMLHMYVSVYVYIIFCLRLRIIEFDLENTKKLLSNLKNICNSYGCGTPLRTPLYVI